MDRDENLKKNIITRLKRVEGQVKGIQGMIDKNACCSDVLIQVAAIRAAINKVGVLILEDYARNCIGTGEGTKNEEKLEDLIKTLNSFVK